MAKLFLLFVTAIFAQAPMAIAVKSAVLAGKFDQAQKLAKDALATTKEPIEQARAWSLLGEIAVSQGNWKEAGSDFEKAVKLFGKSPEASQSMVQLGMLKLKKNDSFSAYELFRKALDLDPAVAPQANLGMGLVGRKEGKNGLAEAHFWDALTQQDPGNAAEVQSIKEAYGQLLAEQSRGAEADSIFRCLGILRPGAPKPDMTVYPVGNDTTPAVTLARTTPKLTNKARNSKVNGSITIMADIQLDGRAHNLQVVKSLGYGLDEGAMDTLREWRFLPGMKNGNRVVVRMFFPMMFSVSP